MDNVVKLRKRQIIIIFILAGFLVSCSLTNQLSGWLKPNPTVTPFDDSSFVKNSPLDMEWKTYKDPEINFTIKYPASWYFYRSPINYDQNTPGGYVLFTTSIDNTSPQYRTDDEKARLLINFNQNDSSITSMDDLLKESPLLLYPVSKFSVNGFEGLRIIAPTDIQNGLSPNSFFFVITPDWTYSLIGSMSELPDSAILNDTIIAMQDSFLP